MLLRSAADLGDSRGVRGEQLRREVAERADHPRLDQLDLLLEIRPAGVDLLRLRITVARRATLEDVRDEDVLPRQPDALEQLGEEASSPANEGQPLAVLLGPGRLTDEDQVGVGVPRPEDDSIAGLRERAALAGRGVVVDVDQGLAPSLRAAHAPPRRRVAARCRLKRSLAPPLPMSRLLSRRRF